MNLKIFLLKFKTWWWWMMTPPYMRQSVMLAWGQAIMQGQEWQRLAFFDGYMSGNIQPAPTDYSPSSTYTTGMRVVYWINGSGQYYGDNAVYECISLNEDGSNNSGFSNKPPITGNIAPDMMPSNITNQREALIWLSQYSWVKVCPYPIGAYQRTSFSCQKLLFEYAFNAWFHTTFRQPPFVSDIYIQPKNNFTEQFFFTEQSGSSFFIPKTIIDKNSPVISRYFFPLNNNIAVQDFVIYIPLHVYTNLSPQSGLRTGIVTNFANKIAPAGCTYQVLTY